MTSTTPAGEEKRLQALRRMRLLDTPSDAAYDRFTALAARVFQTPVAIISLVDSTRTWFKSCHGLPVQEMPRELSFCARAILDDGVLVVPDMSRDLRFSDNPLVINEPWIRFYAAAPLIVEDGQRIGAFAIMDRQPHSDFGSAQCASLRDFAALVSRRIEESARQVIKEKPANLRRENLLASAAESLNDALVIFDAEDRILEISRSAEHLLGSERNELLGRTVADLLAPRYRAQHVESVRSFVETGRSSYFGRRLELPILRSNGQELNVEICTNTNGSGKRTIFIACLRDIAEQTRETEEQQKFISLVENSYDFVSMADFDGRILYLNRSGRKLVGAPDGELNEYHSIEILPADQRRFYGSTVLPAILATGRWQGEMQFQHSQTGELIDVHATMFHLTNRNTGAPLCIATTARDITLQKRADIELRRAKEAAEEAASAKSMFLANMSHEIRTPMNAVIGMTSLMLETNLDAEQREFAEIIRNSGEALLSLIGRVLDFSKIDSGKLDLETTPFSLHECIAETLDLLGPQACDKGLELVFVPDPAAPVCLIGDVGRLRQILVNLVANAIKFTDKGEVSLRVSLGQQPADLEEGECELQFTVRDSGIGIDSERIEQIFEAFTQSDASHARRFGGAGLGLTISRRLAELMGGRMWVGSKLGQGSSFHFTVRLKRDAAATQMTAGAPALRGKRLHLITPSRSMRDSIEQQARMWGAEMQWTQQPSADINADLRIVDMPAAYDAEQQRALIAQLSGSPTPTLLLRPVSQRASHEHIAALDKNGGWRALNKPVKPSSLLDAVQSFFGVAAHEARSASEFSDEAMASHLPYRILLAEDNIVNQKMAELMLGKYGYRIDCVEDGDEAVESLRRQSYDVIFMDMQMPRMDGVAATRLIRSSLPKSAQPWIIAMTANASIDARNECLASGMNDFVTKPVRPQDLKNALLRSPEPRSAKSAKVTGSEYIASAAIQQMYVKSARNVLGELQQHAAVANVEGLRRRAHFLRGSSLVLGASEIARICGELENAALEPEQIHSRLTLLATEIDKTSAELLKATQA